jgi:hypothetical protein
MAPADRQFIFVHIQKTAGTALRAALNVDIKDPHKHFLARELRELHGPSTWNSCFKFGFVRNPWDRLVSWWSFLDSMRAQAGRHGAPNKFTRYVLERAGSFSEFITHCTDEIVDADGRKCIFRNQIDYLTDDRGALIVDFVGRFERLQEDFDKVCERLDRPSSELPHVNSSRHGDYVGYYTRELADMVERRYAHDIKQFGYRFGD